MSTRVRLPDTIVDTADQLIEDYDYSTRGEAIRQMCQEAGYDV